MISDFRHPREAQSLNEFLENKYFSVLLSNFQSIYSSVTDFAEIKDRNFLITEQTYPKLYALFKIAAKRLEVDCNVPLYAKFEYGYCAETVGTDGDCAILISHACIDRFTDKQLLALFGHELSYIKYGKVRYLSMDKMLDSLLAKIPFIGKAAVSTIRTTFVSWRQFSEYTADRAAAIAACGIGAAIDNLRCAMGGDIHSFGIDFHDDNICSPGIVPAGDMTIAGQFVFQSMVNQIQAPFGILRMNELQKWGHSKICQETFPDIFLGKSPDFDFNIYEKENLLHDIEKSVTNHKKDNGSPKDRLRQKLTENGHELSKKIYERFPGRK